MSVIAWDGKTVAADRQGTRHDTVVVEPKLFQSCGYVIGFTGTIETGVARKIWFERGADVDDWPEWMDQGDWDGSILLLFASNGAWVIEQHPVWQKVHEPPRAWGAARDIASAALALGESPQRAVELSCELSIYCGKGVDVFEVSSLAKFNPYPTAEDRVRRKARKIK